MKQSTKDQRGSPSRDHFRWLHKQLLPKNSWALDIDLMLVEKWPKPFIVAALDFKVGQDSLGFAEALTYQRFISFPQPHRIPVYIIYVNQVLKDDAENKSLSEEDSKKKARLEHRFTVKELISADYRPDPPTSETRDIVKNVDWKGLEAWEAQLREKRKAEMKQYVGNDA